VRRYPVCGAKATRRRSKQIQNGGQAAVVTIQQRAGQEITSRNKRASHKKTFSLLQPTNRKQDKNSSKY